MESKLLHSERQKLYGVKTIALRNGKILWSQNSIALRKAKTPKLLHSEVPKLYVVLAFLSAIRKAKTLWRFGLSTLGSFGLSECNLYENSMEFWPF